jgi:hypothetical protein
VLVPLYLRRGVNGTRPISVRSPLRRPTAARDLLRVIVLIIEKKQPRHIRITEQILKSVDKPEMRVRYCNPKRNLIEYFDV